MICPLLIQFAATPLHLLGLDFYNNPNRTAMQRAKFLVDVGGQTLLLRMCRFLPAYGLAGVLNIVLRDHIDNMIKDAIDKEWFYIVQYILIQNTIIETLLLGYNLHLSAFQMVTGETLSEFHATGCGVEGSFLLADKYLAYYFVLFIIFAPAP